MTMTTPPEVTITAEELAAEIGIDLTGHPEDIARARRLLAVATERVNRYAPLTPSVIKNEAVIRFSGYLGGSDFGGVSGETVGPQTISYTSPTHNASAFRSSGAEALLSPYKVRRGGAIG